MKVTIGEASIDVNVHESSFEEAQAEGYGLAYIVDKGDLLNSILKQCTVKFEHKGKVIVPTGDF